MHSTVYLVQSASLWIGRKVDLASVSSSKALIMKSYLPPQFQVKGSPHTQVHCLRYDMSKEPKVSEIRYRRVLGGWLVGVFCAVYSLSRLPLFKTLDFGTSRSHEVIKLMASQCTFFAPRKAIFLVLSLSKVRGKKKNKNHEELFR